MPSTFYGSNCSLEVSSTSFIPDTISVVVTQVLSILTPTDGVIILLNDLMSFPVSLVTSGGNIVYDVITTYSCDHGGSNAPALTTNSALTNINVGSLQYGACSLTMNTTNLPNYLVVFDDSVTFQVKYAI